jgi:ZIP family zinc transporter
MNYVSFVEIFPQARELVIEGKSSFPELSIVLAFFAGIALIFLIDMLIPNAENPHEMHLVEDMDKKKVKQLKRMGVMMALAIGIHNFPEGMATFTSAMVSPEIAIPIAIAIAIHNIPEGIAVSVPIYYATGSRRKAFCYSLL